MSDQTTTIWALLIGIDCYMGRTIDGLPYYGNLGGCVNDILLMEEFLHTRLKVPTERIRKLTASGSGAKPQEPKKELWPIKANIVAAFQDLARQAQRGNQVYIHYSGHGGRAVTLFPEVKGEHGLDESLVPTDYGQIENKVQPEDRYLRDLELVALLQALVDRELIVTVVLDSCHSGGAALGKGENQAEVVVRGGIETDVITRTPSDLVAPRETLMAVWQAQTRSTRAASLGSGWLPDPRGYTLLAACRALELAREYTSHHPAPNGKRQGYLSYWLWDALQKPVLNWEMVHQQVVARVHGTLPNQTPQLQGVGNREVFGGASLTLPVGVNVVEVKDDRLRLNIGKAGGAAEGAQYFIYRKGVTDFEQSSERLAVVKLTDVMDAESWAKVVRRLGGDDVIEPGAQGLLFDPGRGQQRTVRLVRGDQMPTDVEEAAFASLATAMEQSGSRFVRLASEDESAHFQVGITREKAYEIRDASGRPLPNLQPVPVDDPKEAAYRLGHLARYFTLLELTNPDTMSRLAGKLEVRLMRTPNEPFDEPGGIPTVKDTEQTYYLYIRNLFEPVEGPPSDDDEYIEKLRRRTMNITVLNLAPDWSITRLLPPKEGAEEYYDLEPGEILVLPRAAQPNRPQKLPEVRSFVPRGADEALEIFKVFATIDATSYNSWQLPAIDGVRERAALVDPPPPEPERSWITTQVMLQVVK